MVPYTDMITAVPQGGRLVGDEHETVGKVQRAMKTGATIDQPAYEMLHEQVTVAWKTTMVETGGRMWGKARGNLLWKLRCIARQLHRRVCCCPDDNMVWMSVRPIIPKGENHVRPKATQNLRDLANQALLVERLELAVAVIQAAHMLHAKLLTGTVEFLRPHLSQRLARRRACITDLPRLASSTPPSLLRRPRRILPACRRHKMFRRPDGCTRPAIGVVFGLSRLSASLALLSQVSTAGGTSCALVRSVLSAFGSPMRGIEDMFFAHVSTNQGIFFVIPVGLTGLYKGAVH